MNHVLKYLIGFALLFLSTFLRAESLYVGANYHPHDYSPEVWKRDIKLMKEAGLTVVRMGHLAWDSYEPEEGKFTFSWFDQVMDEMDAAGIKVILDIAVRPAPLWLHQKSPSMSIVDGSGNKLYPNHRYMEDVGDPTYQHYALRYTDKLTKHYAKHPALLAFGIDNEPGDGPISYSEAVRERFIKWLKNKYKSPEALSKAWAGQRWSRKITDFNQVGLPKSGAIDGAPERVLDFRRFVSDEVSNFEKSVIAKTKENAPQTLLTGNMWYYSAKKYFDYSDIAYSGDITRAGGGFYPGNSLLKNEGLRNALFGITRVQFESKTPFWGTEFTTMTAVPGSIRKSAYASLMFGSSMVAGWTWQSMPSGEEQYLQGMLDWDGIPNRKYDEYKQIAAEFKKIEQYGFPYEVKADVALAFSFASQIASAAYPEQHEGQTQAVFDALLKRNVDVRMVDISKSSLEYKILVLPGVAVMDQVTADNVRAFVKVGGTVIMTSYSSVVDENNKVFESTRPGLLSDVFGIRVASYEETENMNELSSSMDGKSINIQFAEKEILSTSERFDVINPGSATVMAWAKGLDKKYPLVTVNKYGKGAAIYMGIPARVEALDVLFDQLLPSLSINMEQNVPSGVLVRSLNKSHKLYLNLDNKDKEITLKGVVKSILYDKKYNDSFTLKANDVDFVEIESAQ